MGKRGKKKHGKKKSPGVSKQPSTAQLLQDLKASWDAGKWPEALACYRTWIKRSGGKRDNRIEGEMLFREASFCFSSGKYERAVSLLDEALNKDASKSWNCSYYKAICCARRGKIDLSREIFDELDEDFHRTILSYLIDRNMPFYERVSGHRVIEKSPLLCFWKTLLNAGKATGLPSALSNIGSAFEIYTSGGDPSQPLNLLKRKPGFELLAAELQLICAVQMRKNIKIRNIIKSNPALSKSPSFDAAMRAHVIRLLKENKYDEIFTLDGIFRKIRIQAPLLGKARDESFFQLGLKAIGENHLEKALNYFLQVSVTTPPVLHNTALCYQKLRRYGEANEYWIKLLRIEKKPKRTDPENKRIAYITTLKYIAQNFFQDGALEKAYTYFKEVLTYTKDDREALEALFMITQEMEKYSESLHFSKRLYNLEPDNEEYVLNYIQELHHNKQFNTLIPLYQKLFAVHPDNDLFRKGLASCYLEHAWDIRNDIPREAEIIVRRTKELASAHPKLLYLEGYFLKRKGKKKEAMGKFEESIRYSDSHSLDYDLGVAFYEDGMTKYALKEFKEIASCDCDTSDVLFERCVQFLSDRNDYRNTTLLCDYGIKRKGYTLYDISDMLYDFHKASWAKEYSSRLILQEDTDEDDMFLHLIILNGIGNKEETLHYAHRFHQFCLENNDHEGIVVSKELIRQIKSRGRFKLP